MVPVIVTVWDLAGGRGLTTTPHPDNVETAHSEPIISTPSAIRRRRRLPATKNNPTNAKAGAANGQADPVEAATVAEVWIVSVVVAEVLPGVTMELEKLAVAPGSTPVAERFTAGIVAPFCAVTVTVNCAEPPEETDCAAVGELITKSGVRMPLPFRAIVCGELASLSAMAMTAGEMPSALGLNVMDIEQLVLAATFTPQVLVWR